MIRSPSRILFAQPRGERIGAQAGRGGFLVAWLLGLMLCAALLSGTQVLAAQVNPEPAEVQRTLDAARVQVDKTRKLLQADGPIPDAELIRLRDEIQSVRADAGGLADKLEPELAGVQARLQELGTPVPGVVEAADIAERRAQLEKARGALDGQVKLARLLAVESGQVSADILALRRQGFQARLGERTASVLNDRFWRDVRAEMPADTSRLALLAGQLRQAAAGVPAAMWLALALVTLALVVIRIWLGRIFLRLTASRVPAGRLRRSFYAVAVVVLTVVTPVLIAQSVHFALHDNAPLSEIMGDLLKGMVGALAFGGYVAGLGQALLSPDRPSWRLPPVPDQLALRLRWFPWLLAVVLVLAWLVDQLAAALDASLVSTVVINAGVALALCLVLGVALWRGERLRRLARRDPEHFSMPAQPWWLSTLIAAAWATVGLSLLSLLTGYVALGSFLIKQVAWTLVVLCSAYLLIALVDDVFSAMLGARAERDDSESSLPRTRDQAAVLLAGLGRVAIVLLAVAMLLAPFGEGPSELADRASILSRGIAIGAISIRPGAVLQGLLVFVLALVAVGMIKRWLADRYLPTTGLDPGMRVSAATLFGYAGFVLAVALALVAVGIGLERVAWVASALSVGIGFGLQAVVQNFVSGLIMLAERPVKVGDWVSLGGVEGDIRRINARATEIQMGDRSTLIVPNSEFITKTVRNITHTNPLGLVSFKLPMPLDTDAELAQRLILNAFEDHDSVLDAPAPAVFLDGVDGKNLVFNATGYVASPRLAYGVRSALLFDVLKRLREAGVSMLPPVLQADAMDRAP